jgi:FMN phosphatase YigB (HAD superfamily)
MKPTKLEWEDVTKFEEVKGYGQHIWRDEDKYYLVLEEGTVASWLVVYELPNDLFALLDSGERTLSEVSWKIKYDSWPPTEEEKNEIRKDRARKKPIVLISNRKNQLLFSNKELEILIPKAEQQWIESMGKLPDDYVSPLK